MKEKVELRRAKPSDYDEIARVWHESASLPGVGPPTMPLERDLRVRVDQEMCGGWSVTLATQSDRVLGFVACKPAIAVLDQLFIRPEAIGLGLGMRLFNQARIEMPNGFTLHTAATNKRARKFYERAGMVVSREGPHPRSGHPVVWYGWPEAPAAGIRE
ncbi:GNAT family N-acetyltransferase [Erythrobacter sp.]|uniref:GNAT family N-acetyltransferase n=1 Tax=Erythrobacter sp. TaxID=1042 RepID=UPI00311D557A